VNVSPPYCGLGHVVVSENQNAGYNAGSVRRKGERWELHDFVFDNSSHLKNNVSEHHVVAELEDNVEQFIWKSVKHFHLCFLVEITLSLAFNFIFCSWVLIVFLVCLPEKL